MSTAKKTKYRLEAAWYIAFNSMTFGVTGKAEHSEEILKEAYYRIQQIDRSEWFPYAENIIDQSPSIDPHKLAVQASELFINKAMNTSGLTVYLGGDT